MATISAVKDLFTKPLSCLSSVSVNDLVYLSASDTADKASASASGTANILGFVALKPTTTTCIVQVAGEVDGLSGLVAQTKYYLANTAGTLATTPGTVYVFVGIALDTTTLLLTGGGGSGGGGGSSPFVAGSGVNSAVLAGGSNVASGKLSVAEGKHSLASGKYSHAEAYGIASGAYSHAEADGGAIADYAHAEGISTAAGYVSHSENRSFCYGYQAHSEGNHTYAWSNQSHAEGLRTKTGIGSRFSFTRTGNTVTIAGDKTANFSNGEYIIFIGTNIAQYDFVNSVPAFASGNTTFNVSGIGTSIASGFIANTSRGTGAHSEGHYATAQANYTHAGGGHSFADKWSQFARGAGKFTTLGDAQHSFLTGRLSTTDNSAHEMFLDGDTATQRCTIATNTTWSALIRVVAQQKNSDGAAAAQFDRKCIVQNAGGTVALIGSVQTIGTDIGSNAGAPPAGWAVTITADNTNKSLKIAVTGAAATNVRWVALIELVEVLYA